MSRTIRYVKYGQWAAHAPAVAALVREGHGVSEAVRLVMAKYGHTGRKAFNGIRAAYYERRGRQKKDTFQI